MRKQAMIMGMPITINIVDRNAKEKDIEEIFSYFCHIDNIFSTYKQDSDITKINNKTISVNQAAEEVKYILALAKQTKQETQGYFDVYHNNTLDPSGIVKGFAIFQGAEKLRSKGYKNFFIEIAGDIEINGTNGKDEAWKVGIENPFNRKEIIQVLNLTNQGIATSGTYIRGNHIYNPKKNIPATDIASITIIGPNVYDADRFATAAFAMGKQGLPFIEQLSGFEAYMIDNNQRAYYTSGFKHYATD